MNRSAFLVASGTAFALTSGAASAQDIPGGPQLVERNANFASAAFDALVGRPAQIRQVYETVSFKPGILSSIKNSFNGLHFGFGYPNESIAVALAGHGSSSVYAYSDYLWQKYRLGEFLSLTDAQGATLTSNVFLKRKAMLDPTTSPDDPKGMYQDAAIETLQHRGLIVLTCHTAVEEQARQLVAKGYAAGMAPTDVADDILTHLIPGAFVVPSMVATIAVLQARYHYTYISPEL